VRIFFVASGLALLAAMKSQCSLSASCASAWSAQ